MIFLSLDKMNPEMMDNSDLFQNQETPTPLSDSEREKNNQLMLRVTMMTALIKRGNMESKIMKRKRRMPENIE